MQALRISLLLLAWCTSFQAFAFAQAGKPAEKLSGRVTPPAVVPAIRVYFGTYTKGPGKGIFVADFDDKTGKLTDIRPAAEANNPSFLAVHPNRKFVYAVSEVSKVGENPGGSVSAFAVDDATGTLTLLNSESTIGAGPCHLTMDSTGRNLLVANYSGGSTAVLPVSKDGRLKPCSAHVIHKDAAANPTKQKAPHAHCVKLDATDRFAFVADLGLDRVFIYRFDAELGKLLPREPQFVSVAPGAGPRHFAFHPDGKSAFVINELNSTLTAFKYDSIAGNLEIVKTLSTLPPFYVSANYPAEVVVHPNGKFVYGSNRGHNSIACFKIDETGNLLANGHQKQDIKNPRNFNIDPSGHFLLVANQDLDTVVVFKIDATNGTLQATNHKISVAKPTCVKFLVR